MLDEKQAVAELLKSPATHLYFCGPKCMEDGVIASLKAIAKEHALDWPSLHTRMKTEGRIHLETY